MASPSTFPENSDASVTILNEDQPKKPFNNIISTLPTERGWGTKHVVGYQGFWFPDYAPPAIISLQRHFKSIPNQTLLASHPKSGTTWLKALVFAITNQNNCSSDDANHPLLDKNPHELVPVLEFYAKVNPENPNPDLPIVATHIPYSSLPKPLVDSDSKIVYVARNPNDVLISYWLFSLKLRSKELPPLSLDVAYEAFCNGVSPYGSYWDHVLGYWNASLQFPEKVLFLNYDELKENGSQHVKRLADFLGHPFSPEQEEQGVVEKIISLCSFETLSNLEVNKTGVHSNGKRYVQNDVFFRKGKVGDWKNYLSKEMAEHLNGIVVEKFKGSGLKPFVLSSSTS